MSTHFKQRRNGSPGAPGKPNRGRSDSKPGRPVPTTLDALTSAYNWVPLADWVYFPEWAMQVSQDRPFRDGISGTLDFVIEAHTPLLVADTKGDGNRRRFIKDPRGNYAIPGTTLRGMIRSVLEIASFGKFQRLDDSAISLRDLRNKKQYIDRFSKKCGTNTYASKAQAGWLYFDATQRCYRLAKCNYARVEYSDINEWAQGKLSWARGDQRGYRRCGAMEKYKQLEQCGLHVDLWCDVEDEETRHNHKGKQLLYRKASGLCNHATDGKQDMTLVFTGHPGGNKHMDFAFYPLHAIDEEQRFNVPQEVMSSFQQVHEDSDIWNKRWLPRVRRGDAVPVFFLLENNKFAAIGLSQLFRLPHKYTLKQAAANTSAEHGTAEILDLAECIFGAVFESEAWPNLRGRVSFDPATAVAGTCIPVKQPMKVILNGPKPGFHPSYVVQPNNSHETGRLDAKDSSTLSTEGAQLRGWKRYPVRERINPPPPTAQQAQNDKVASSLVPLEPGARFNSVMRFHNLRPVELGALLWVMEWGGDATLRHALGMGKPFGMGQVSIKLGRDQLRLRDNAGRLVELAQCLQEFEARMNKESSAHMKYGGIWTNTVQMKELLAMADPNQSKGKDLRAPVMQPNEFALAKGAHEHPKLVLRRYKAIKSGANKSSTPRSSK